MNTQSSNDMTQEAFRHLTTANACLRQLDRFAAEAALDQYDIRPDMDADLLRLALLQGPNPAQIQKWMDAGRSENDEAASLFAAYEFAVNRAASELGILAKHQERQARLRQQQASHTQTASRQFSL